MTSRRGFIAQLAALMAAGPAALAILARLRPSSRTPLDGYIEDTFNRADNCTLGSASDGAWSTNPPGPYRIRNNRLEAVSENVIYWS